MKFRAVVTADVTLSTAGAGTITVFAPGIMRATGALQHHYRRTGIK